MRNVQPLYAEWNETWDVLKLTYVGNTQTIVFKVTDQFC